MTTNTPLLHNNPEWTRILSFLTLADLECLSQCYSSLKQIISSYLKNEHQLVIDDDTLFRYPIKHHKQLYDHYGSLTINLTINGCKIHSIETIYPFFRKIQQLNVNHVEGLCYLELSRHFPNLKKLIFTFNKAGANTFEQTDSLQSLYLHGNRPLVLPIYPQLESLTLIQQRITIPSDFQCSSLKSLTLEYCWTGLPYATVKKLPQLQHLRILRPVDWKKREQIEALNLQKADFFCYEIPSDQNLILRKLNEDCLRCMTSFLGTEDKICLREVHPIFHFLEIPPVYLIDRDSLYHRPLHTNWDCYTSFAPLVQKLSVYQFLEDGVLEPLPLFTNIQELSLHSGLLEPEDRRKRHWIKYIPNGLRKLSIFGDAIHNPPSLLDVFRRLNPTLETLNLECAFKPRSGGSLGLDELRRIKEFRCDDLSVCLEFINFLNYNKDTLRNLEITVRGGYHPWAEIAKLKLRSLTIRLLDRFEWDHGSMGNDLILHKLRELSIEHKRKEGIQNHSNLAFLKMLNGSKIRSFSYIGHSENFSFSLLERLRNLKELYLKLIGTYKWDNLSPGIFSMTKLRVLTLYGCQGVDLLSMVKGMPCLIVCNLIMGDKLDDEVVAEGKVFLRKAGRKLRLNGKELTEDS